jgi:DHA2 family multidrug resistance protein-like MFS transporter
VGFAAIFLALNDFAQNTVSGWTLLEVCIAIPAIFLLGKRTSTRPDSMVPLDLLKLGSLRKAYVMSAAAYAVLILITLSFPFILQQRFQFEPDAIGLLMVILAGGAILLSLMQPGVSTFLIVLAAAVCGIGFGIFQVPNNHSMLATAPHSRSGAASAMLSLSRLIGQTLGALMAALLFRKIGAQSGAPIVAAALIAIGVASATLLRKGRSRSTIVE